MGHLVLDGAPVLLIWKDMVHIAEIHPQICSEDHARSTWNKARQGYIEPWLLGTGCMTFSSRWAFVLM